MASQGWETARDGMVALWQRFQPSRSEAVAEDLAATREELLGSGPDSETELVAEWQARVRRLLLSHPDVAGELRRILDELHPQPSSAESGTTTLNARASGRGRVYQAGRDQHISER
ncbi:hypothetical protein ACGFXC_33445 [Streptomyces sp. NPDC048507]|uniref:hypothetical protein n=1 Tax=Streptomyces sp. NPDC048507 TaxID=3365560 RepID=UPI003713656B